MNTADTSSRGPESSISAPRSPAVSDPYRAAFQAGSPLTGPRTRERRRSAAATAASAAAVASGIARVAELTPGGFVAAHDHFAHLAGRVGIEQAAVVLAAAVGAQQVDHGQREEARDRAREHDHSPPPCPRARKQQRDRERERHAHDHHPADAGTESGRPLQAGQRRPGQRHRRPCPPSPPGWVKPGCHGRQHEHRQRRLEVVANTVEAGPQGGVGTRQRAQQQLAARQRVGPDRSHARDRRGEQRSGPAQQPVAERTQKRAPDRQQRVLERRGGRERGRQQRHHRCPQHAQRTGAQRPPASGRCTRTRDQQQRPGGQQPPQRRQSPPADRGEAGDGAPQGVAVEPAVHPRGAALDRGGARRPARGRGSWGRCRCSRAVPRPACRWR